VRTARPLSRRSFLAWAQTCALGALFLPGFRFPPLSATGSEGLPQSLAKAFGSHASRLVVGGAYVRLVPEEACVDLLVQYVGGSRLLSDIPLAELKPCQIRAQLTRQIRDDFSGGRLVEVDGWLLSVTEARLCALAWLL